MGYPSQCHFCGAVLGQYNKAPGQAVARFDGRSWQEIVYYILAAIWVLQGLYTLLQGLHVIHSTTYIGASAAFAEKMSSFISIIGVLNIAVGVGLLFENVAVQLIVKWFSIFNLFFAALGLLMVFAMPNAASMIIVFLTQAFQIAFLGLQVYVINTIGDV